MSAEWRLEPWGALRVAGLPGNALRDLRLTQSANMVAHLDMAESHLDALREAMVDSLFVAIPGCDDLMQRRAMLALKRKLFAGSPIEPALTRFAAVSDLPATLRAGLADVATAEANVAKLTSNYEALFAEECRTLSDALWRQVKEHHLATRVLLSSSDVAHAVHKLEIQPPDIASSTPWLKLETTLARYLFRATTRTTPFGAFTAVALLSLLDETRGPAAPEDWCGPHQWRSVPQVQVGALWDWISDNLNADAAANLPLRATPVRRITPGPIPEVEFRVVRSDQPTSGHAEAPSRRGAIWQVVRFTPIVQQVMAVADGRSTNEIVDLLAASDEERSSWHDLLESLVQVGLLERVLPRQVSSPRALEELAARFDHLGDGNVARHLRWVAGLLTRYAIAPAEQRLDLHSTLRRGLGLPPGTVPIYEDVLLDGLTTADLGVAPDDLRQVLQPALALVRSSLSNEAHRLICAAFIDRYGPDGMCEDVPGFLVELLRDEALLSRIRRAHEPVAWRDSRFGAALENLAGTCLSLDPALFEELPATNDPCAVAAFVQLIARDRLQVARGRYRVVLNGIQSGRNKYLSRYLGGGGPVEDAALSAVRDRFAAIGGPLPVEIMPVMDLNFQLHPQLTAWALQIPGDLSPDAEKTLPLTDLRLRYDLAAGHLQVFSSRLERELKLVHLGFLRDINLPDSLLLLRALSSRMADDTVAERTDIYTVLDRANAARTLPLRRYRPRLEVGRLVLERARWAIPLSEVPVKSPRESHAAYFRRFTRWRVGENLPERGFARRLEIGAPRAAAYAPPQYVDWRSPYTLAGLGRLIGGPQSGPDIQGWLLITELLPVPEEAALQVNGHAHVSELLIQFEWEPGHGFTLDLPKDLH